MHPQLKPFLGSKPKKPETSLSDSTFVGFVLAQLSDMNKGKRRSHPAWDVRFEFCFVGLGYACPCRGAMALERSIVGKKEHNLHMAPHLEVWLISDS